MGKFEFHDPPATFRAVLFELLLVEYDQPPHNGNARRWLYDHGLLEDKFTHDGPDGPSMPGCFLTPLAKDLLGRVTTNFRQTLQVMRDARQLRTINGKQENTDNDSDEQENLDSESQIEGVQQPTGGSGARGATASNTRRKHGRKGTKAG